MDAFREELYLRLARELAISHGTLFAAALLAEVGVPLPVTLATLARKRTTEPIKLVVLQF